MNHNNKQEGFIKVAGSSSVKNTAGCLVKFVNNSDNRQAELRAVGASAVNQMIKAVAVARGIFATQGYDLCLRVGFCDTVIGDTDKTALRAIAFLV